MPRRLNFPALRTVRRAVRLPHGALGVLAAEQGAPAASGNSALFRDSCQPRLSPLIDSVTGGSCECKMLLLFHYPNGFPGSVEERWEVTWDLGTWGSAFLLTLASVCFSGCLWLLEYMQGQSQDRDPLNLFPWCQMLIGLWLGIIEFLKHEAVPGSGSDNSVHGSQ